MAPALVQAKGIQQAALTLAFTSNVTAGNTLVLYIGVNSTGQTFTASDNLNGAWTAIPSCNFNTTFASVNMLQHANTAAGACTVTVAGGAGASLTIIIHEFSGMPSSTTVRVGNTAEGTSAAPAASLAGTTAGDLIVGGCQVANTAAVGAGFSAGANDANGDQSEWQVGAGGTISLAFTQTSGLFVVSAAALAPAGGAVAAPIITPRRMPLSL
jgi:hypothetical protein